jgi:hypothetical protein
MRTSTQSLANAVQTPKPLPIPLSAWRPTPDQRRKRLWRVPPAIVICLLMATFLTLAALLAPWLAPSNPTAQKLLGGKG